MSLQSPLSLTGMLSSVASDTAATTADARSLAVLRNGATRDPKSAIKETSRQFETLFMQQLLKGMREAQSAMSTGMLTNQGTQLGNEMLDAEYAKKMSGAPGGLADVIARQLERQLGNVTPPADSLSGTPPTGAPGAAVPATGHALSTTSQRQLDFVQRHTEAARVAEAQTGIPASFMVAQAAHESGWGRHEIKNADGSTSFNVFGIKAGSGWTGRVAEVTTTEVIDGTARKVTAKFRAYDSYQDAFNDYARLMKESPRYSRVVADAGSGTVGAARFAQGLQRAGYATDPAYADKLTRVINTTLRLQRVITT